MNLGQQSGDNSADLRVLSTQHSKITTCTPQHNRESYLHTQKKALTAFLMKKKKKKNVIENS